MDIFRTRVAILGAVFSDNLKPFFPSFAKDSTAPQTSGGSNITNLVVARLSRGWPTDIVTLVRGSTERIQMWEAGASRLWILQHIGTGLSPSRGYPSETRILRAVLRQADSDLIHANWTYEYALAALSQHDKPVVLTPHDHADRILRMLGWRYLARWIVSQSCLRRAKILTAPSPAVAAYASRRAGRPVAVIPNLLPDELWNECPSRGTLSQQKLRVVSALDWSSLKNTTTALRAFSFLKTKFAEANYILAGSGLEQGGAAAQWAVAHNCADGVQFMGRIPYSQMLTHIAEANILLHSSLEECMPGPVLEAMALRVPVVAAREASGSEWLLDGGLCGRLCSGHDANSMGDALLNSVSQSAVTRTMVNKAYTRAFYLSQAAYVLDAYNVAYTQAIHTN